MIRAFLARLLTRIAPSQPPEPSRLDLWDGLGTPRDDVMAEILEESRARTRARRYQWCDDTRTVDCGHCKGKPTRVRIDPNVRVRDNGTFAGFEDAEGPLTKGADVEVYESESGLRGRGVVEEIDPDARLVFLSVDWANLEESRARSVRHTDDGRT